MDHKNVESKEYYCNGSLVDFELMTPMFHYHGIVLELTEVNLQHQIDL